MQAWRKLWSRLWPRLWPKTRSGAIGRGVLLGVFAFGVYSLWIEPASLRVVHHDIALGGKGLGRLRIAVIADLHAGSAYIGVDKVRRVVALANASKPDLILLAGDYVGGGPKGSYPPVEVTASLLKELRAPLGVFAVIGNHDRWLSVARVTKALQAVGIPVLENASLPIGNFTLVGIGDAYTHADFPARALKGVHGPALCFTHSPDVFPELPRACVLTIAGHTHGGQVWLPLAGRLITASRYGQRYAAGLVRENGKTLFVSTGIGTSIVPIRFLVPPEVTVLDLH